MYEKNYLMFDFGASHGRSTVAAYNGKTFQMDEVHEFENHLVKYADVTYWDLLYLVNEMQSGIIKAFKKYPYITSVGIDTWGCDFGLLDQYGKLMSNPVSYRDELRYKYRQALHDSFGEYEIYRLGGANTNNIMGLYHLYALKQERPAELDHADKLLMMPDLFNYFLTGEIANEYTDATMSLLVNQKEKIWENTIINKLGLPGRIFQKIAMPGSVLGNIKKELCSQLNIPEIPVINVASHDTASAVAGIPTDGGYKNWGFISLGTWAIIGIETDEIYNSKEVFASGFGTQGGCEGKNNFVNLISGLWVIQQCYQLWNKLEGNVSGWDQVEKAADKAPAGKAFINLDDVKFSMPNKDMPCEVACYCSDSGQAIPEGIGGIARCVYESLTLKLKDCYENIVRITGKKLDVLHVVGGGSRSSLLCQWISDATGIPVKAGPSETTTIGNLLIQLKGTKEISNLNEGRKIAKDSCNLKEYYPKEKEKWDEYYARYIRIMKG